MQEAPRRLSPLARLNVWAAPAILQIRDFCRDCIEDIPLITRLASHVGLLFLMLVTIAASNIRLSNAAANDSSLSNSDPESPFLTNDIPDDDDWGLPGPMPITNIPKRLRREVVKYEVRPGDTVSDIASQFDVSADSILWANPKLEDNPDMLSLGQVLNIPPTTGVLYTVQNGDTLPKIADKFKTAKTSTNQLVQNILGFEFNQELHDLKSADVTLTTGQFLMVPGGTKPFVPRMVTVYSGPIPTSAARGSGNFGWPVSGAITQKFWGRHNGIDVGAPKGTPVRAADSGYVTFAGWDREPVSYGNMILINHGNGYTTRYAHLSAFMVEAGDSVKKGQLIGRVGSTGNSTGPHLHFEIIRNGVARNPFSFLR
jgi:murein DD-endopeptidase MepM/ murein hydrolase activator NlpD